MKWVEAAGWRAAPDSRRSGPHLIAIVISMSVSGSDVIAPLFSMKQRIVTTGVVNACVHIRTIDGIFPFDRGAQGTRLSLSIL